MPVRGREQSGVRPAIVLTDNEYHRRNETAIICPITSNTSPWPTKVILPEGLAAEGAILVDQIRSVDRSVRGFRRMGNVPEQVLAEVRKLLAVVLGVEIASA
jgi:mRNA-degrading endonuclease toxin of MazEF toxin-antitoxin module